MANDALVVLCVSTTSSTLPYSVDANRFLDVKVMTEVIKQVIQGLQQTGCFGVSSSSNIHQISDGSRAKLNEVVVLSPKENQGAANAPPARGAPALAAPTADPAASQNAQNAGSPQFFSSVCLAGFSDLNHSQMSTAMIAENQLNSQPVFASSLPSVLSSNSTNSGSIVNFSTPGSNTFSKEQGILPGVTHAFTEHPPTSSDFQKSDAVMSVKTPVDFGSSKDFTQIPSSSSSVISGAGSGVQKGQATSTPTSLNDAMNGSFATSSSVGGKTANGSQIAGNAMVLPSASSTFDAQSIKIPMMHSSSMFSNMSCCFPAAQQGVSFASAGFLSTFALGSNASSAMQQAEFSASASPINSVVFSAMQQGTASVSSFSFPASFNNFGIQNAGSSQVFSPAAVFVTSGVQKDACGMAAFFPTATTPTVLNTAGQLGHAALQISTASTNPSFLNSAVSSAAVPQAEPSARRVDLIVFALPITQEASISSEVDSTTASNFNEDGIVQEQEDDGDNEKDGDGKKDEREQEDESGSLG